MSLLRLNILKKFYERYRNRYGYGIDTWEDDLTGIHYICVTDLLFPEIDLKESIFDSSNYTDVSVRTIIPYTLRAEIEECIDNQDEEYLAEESSARPSRLGWVYYCKVDGIEVWE